MLKIKFNKNTITSTVKSEVQNTFGLTAVIEEDSDLQAWLTFLFNDWVGEDQNNATFKFTDDSVIIDSSEELTQEIRRYFA